MYAFVTLPVVSVMAWAYWPTLVEIEATWRREPDYSHGYLVIPAVLYFLWSRRANRPETISGPAWSGLFLIVLACLLRFVAGKYFLSAIDGWSIPVVVCGIVWLLMGADWAKWSWSAVAFLAFTVPLPYRLETFLSFPLQRIATIVSCWTLQCFGYAAVQQGNTILLEATHIEVEQACSGLRMLTSVVALVFAYMILRPAEWWQRSLLLVGAVPIALAANCVRIVLTAVLLQSFRGDTAVRVSHDFAGLFMIPLAGGLLWLYAAFVNRLVIEMEPVVITKMRS